MEAYTEIINKNLADEPSFAVAVNNLVALKGSKDVSDSLRKLDRLKEKGIESFRLSASLEKLSSKQRETIYANRVLLLLHANKMDQVYCFTPLFFCNLLFCVKSVNIFWICCVCITGTRTCCSVARNVS